VNRNTLKKLRRGIRDREAQHERAEDYATNAAWRLRKICASGRNERGDFDTSAAASGAARFLSLLVHNDWDSGEFLCVEWALDRLLGEFVKRHARCVDRIHHALQHGAHDRRNPIVWNDLDNSAFFVPCPLDDRHDDRRAFVLDSQGRSTLFVQERNAALESRTIHVRHLHRRTGSSGLREQRSLASYIRDGMKLEYNDCRDAGYILSCSWGGIPKEATVDRGHLHFSEITHILWWLRQALEAVKTGCSP